MSDQILGDSSHGQVPPLSLMEITSIFLLCTAILLLLKYPYLGLPLLYFDDGETLYQALSLANGRIPYRDVYTHHFLGYVLPIVALIKVFGYSIDLIRYGYIANQVLLGVGTYLCARIFFNRSRSTIGALLAITAREPFVYSFFPLAQVSCANMFILWLSLGYLAKPKPIYLIASALISGIAFSIDQRGLLLLLIPCTALFLSNRNSLKSLLSRGSLIVAAFMFVPGMLIATIWSHDALTPFIDQTVVFPNRFRVASMSLLDKLSVALSMHNYLASESPILSLLALAGCTRLLALKGEQSANSLKAQRRLVLFLPLLLFIIAALGGRNFSYYTIPWLPWLALTALFSVDLLKSSRLLHRFGYPILISPLLITLISFPAFLNYVPELSKRNEALQIAEYIRTHIRSGETLFVFGYRPDIYAAVPMLGASPLVNVIYIHPDSLIRGYQERLRHIDPIIQQEFTHWLETTPPTYLVLVNLPVGDADRSPSSMLVREILAQRYSKVMETGGPQVEEKESTLEVYRLK